MTPEYFAAVEQAFLIGAGRGVLLSARDQEIVLRWARAEFPVHVVVEAITEALRAPLNRVRSMAYVVPAVEEAVAAWRRRQLESNPFENSEVADDSPWAGPAVGAAFEALLGRIEVAGKAQTEAMLRGVLRDAWLAVRDLRDRCRREPQLDPVEALRRTEREIEEAATVVLPLDDRLAIEAEVDRVLAVERRRSDPAAFAEVRAAQLWRAVRLRVGLPAFALRLDEALLDAPPVLDPDVRPTVGVRAKTKPAARKEERR